MAKKNFKRRIKQISREYEEEKVAKAVKSAELDHNTFWKMLKRERDGPHIKTSSVKNKAGKVVHDVHEILDVWQLHFATLGTPAESDNFDHEFYVMVNNKLDEYNASREIDDFSREEISYDEVRKGITFLNAGKAPGLDGVTKEHLTYAGAGMINIISLLFNMILVTEYIPKNFREGVQIPLHKGKNMSTLDVNNYRGITLLSTLDKLFKVVIWKRLEKWWSESGVITQLQGACRKGLSCVHSAFLLQESIYTLLETHKKVFVTYLDISKAFDGVWIGSLFYRLWEIGIRGRTWRLLYNSYSDFMCRVRIQNQMLEGYPLRCRIHQGGYLSLIKYLAFINSLLVNLENSNLCSTIYGTSVSPLGYADDVASASTSKAQTDQVLKIVYDHSCQWRYKFNPPKSAVVVYGETERENKNNSKYRTYRLGKDVIKEAVNYDHLGLRNNCLGNSNERTSEQIRKGRKALNAVAGLGLKPGGLSVNACGIIFWAMVIPIIAFACELWVMDDDDIKMLEDFQTYAGRRIQRFDQRSPRATSYVGLGWIRIETFIYIKKLLFVRTIAVLGVDSVYKRIFVNHLNDYIRGKERCNMNRLHSPTFDILRISDIFGLLNDVRGMILGTKSFCKKQWKDIVWAKAWDIDNQDWKIRTALFQSTKYLKATLESVKPLVWWQLGDMSPELMQCCETMSKLVCRSSKLRSDCYQFKNDVSNRPYCNMCLTLAVEDIEHLIMHCTYLNDIRGDMLNEISRIEDYYQSTILSPTDNNLHILLGKANTDHSYEAMIDFYRVVAKSVHQMYLIAVSNREGVG